MKAACLLLVLGLAQAEEGPQDAAYWAQKKANMKSGNVIQKPNTGVNLRQKVTSASDYWAQKKAQKSSVNSNADYWTKKMDLANKAGPASKPAESDEPCPNG